MKIHFMCFVALSVCLVQASDESAPGFGNNEQVAVTMPPLGDVARHLVLPPVSLAPHEEDPVASALMKAREAKDPVLDFLQGVMAHPNAKREDAELLQKLTKEDPIYGIGSPEDDYGSEDDNGGYGIPDVKLEVPTIASEDDSKDSKAREEMAANQQELDSMMLLQQGPSGLEMGGVSNKAMMKLKKRPGYIRRCVVTSHDHARYARQHAFYENAMRRWKKFGKQYAYAKNHFGHFKHKKRSQKTKRMERYFVRRSMEARAKARHARHSTRHRHRRNKMSMLVEMNQEPVLLQMQRRKSYQAADVTPDRPNRRRHRKSCSGRSWCETFHACKRGDRRVNQFHSWVKGQGYRFYKGACAHSNGRYGRRHKFWRGNHTFAQCKARCDRMGRSCQGITMTKAVKCRGRALSNYYLRRAQAAAKHAMRRSRLARVAGLARRGARRARGKRARELNYVKRLRERARKARVNRVRKGRTALAIRRAAHYRERARKARLAVVAREKARKARIARVRKSKPRGPGYRWTGTHWLRVRKPRGPHWAWHWNGRSWRRSAKWYHHRRMIHARRLKRAAAKMRERAKKARVYATRITWNQVRVARMKARNARKKLTQERSNKKEARCLHWIWWPKKRANAHWYQSKHYSRIVERARMAYRRRFGFSAKTPALSAVPVRKRRVYRQANYGNVSKRLLTNVFELKAYCISVHEKILGARKGNHKLSSIGSFLYRYGVDKKTRNAFGEFKALTRSYTKFYKYGINKYVFDNARKAMTRGKGLLFLRNKHVKLNHQMLGLQTGEARAFDKWSVRWKPFLRAVYEVKYNNGYLSTALKARKEFKKEQCKCKVTRRFAKFGKCSKHMAYDRKPWCVVNNRCEGASYNRRYRFKWQYC